MTDTVNQNTRSRGKIFISEEICQEVLVKPPSFGHHIIDKLSNENADTVIFVDVASGREWTGRQVKEKILNIATALIDKHDFKQGTVVCLSYDHSDYSCILNLAINCAGGVVACMYPKDPYAELLYLARKVDSKFLFCYQKNLDWAEQLELDLGHKVTAIAIGGDARSFEPFMHFEHLLNYDYAKSKSLHLVPVACKDISTDVAFITMSSGTTGRPKAVPSTHERCLAEVAMLSTKKRKGVIFASSSSLDYVSGRLVAFGSIESGYKIIIINGFEPKSYAEAIEKYKINVVYIGAASFYSLITYKELGKYDISSVVSVFPMGAKIVYLDELRRFFEDHTHIKEVRQGYGTSEFSGGAMNSMSPEEYLSNCDNCGKLLPGFRAKIVDPATGQLLGPLERGVLHVKGSTNFPGYYDAEQCKKETLDNNSSGTEASPFVRNSTVFDEDGFYITGDIAYFNEREQLFIVGREKELMSCRGAKKVLPQELEDFIEQHPAVSEVCVLGIPNKVELTLHCPRAFIVPKAIYYTDEQIELSDRPKKSSQNETEILVHKGEHKLCKLPEERRRLIAEDIMDYVNDRVGWEKQLTGGIVLLDEMLSLRSTGKIDKGYLASLSIDRIEIYGDRSG